MRLGVIEATGRSCGRPIVWLVCALLVAGPSPVAPAIIQVGGACDLVEAIENANGDASINPDCAAGSGADTIQLTGNVTLTAIDNSTDGDNGLPSITSEITVDGGGRTIERDAGAPPFRIFHVAAAGDLLLDQTTVTGGRLEGSSGLGAGVFNLGTLTLSSSTVSDNTIDTGSDGYGGGIYNLGSATLHSSTVTGNSIDSHYAFGGGVFSYLGAVLDAELSEISNNSVTGFLLGGGGVETWGIATLIQSTVSGNSGLPTGDYASLNGAGINFVRGSLTLVSSTISGNTGYSAPEANGALLFGGGLAVDDGLLNLSASTISGNSLTAASGFSAALGGGVDHGDATGTLSYSTLSGNSVSAGVQADGGALYLGSGAGLNLIATLIADSSGGNCAGIGTLNDIQNNLADDASCATVPSTLTGLDTALLDNGGPTKTHALVVGSGAIDLAGTCGIPTDQRGVERDDGACDSGSFELNECLAPDGNQAIAEGMIAGEQTIEVCYAITTGPSLEIQGPGGHLILRAGSIVSLGDGTVVDQGGELSIEIDPALMM